MIEQNARRLLAALARYYQANGSYAPVDTPTMQQAVQVVQTLLDNRDYSPQARIDRVLGSDELEQPVQALTNLATALSDSDDTIHDALMYINGDII